MLFEALGSKLTQASNFGRKLANNALNFGSKVASKVRDISYNLANTGEKVLNTAENIGFGIGDVVKNTVSPYARMGIAGARKVGGIASGANEAINILKLGIRERNGLEK